MFFTIPKYEDLNSDILCANVEAKLVINRIDLVLRKTIDKGYLLYLITSCSLFSIVQKTMTDKMATSTLIVSFI